MIARLMQIKKVLNKKKRDINKCRSIYDQQLHIKHKKMNLKRN
jgi:hypothetical protein